MLPSRQKTWEIRDFPRFPRLFSLLLDDFTGPYRDSEIEVHP